MISDYIELPMLFERIHMMFADVIKRDILRTERYDITTPQAIMLYNMEKKAVTFGDIADLGYYTRTNPAHNVNKLVANGYLIQEASQYDKRIRYLYLSEKGLAFREEITILLEGYATEFKNTLPDHLLGKGTDTAVELINALCEFWRRKATTRI